MARTFSSSLRVGALVLALVAAGCSSTGELGGQSPTVPASATVPTAPATSTTAEAPVPSEPTSPSDGGAPVLTAGQIEDCTADSLPTVPKSRFRFIAEDKLFECLDVDDYRFAATMQMDSDLGQEFDRIEMNSQATLVEGEPKFHSFGAVDERPYEVTRVGDTVWVIDSAGASSTLNVAGVDAFALLDLESTQAQLALGGLGLTLIGFYGGGAVMVGPEEIDGRNLTRWTAGPEELTEHVNSTGVLPVAVEVQSGSIDIWTDINGFVHRAEVVLEADDVLLNGTPALEFPGAVDSGLLFDGTFELGYLDLGVPNIIEPPG